MSKKQMEHKITKIVVKPVDDPIFSENATTIEILDEAGGEFVVVKQIGDYLDVGEIRISPEEWSAIRDGIETMISRCGADPFGEPVADKTNP